MLKQTLIMVVAVLALVFAAKFVTQTQELSEAAKLASITNSSDCISAGGVMKKACMAQIEMCVIEYSDAGKPCENPSDCKGTCLSKDVSARIGDDVEGQCSSSSNPCGCFAPVLDGKVEAYRCVD